jgi:hypothetical protein
VRVFLQERSGEDKPDWMDLAKELTAGEYRDMFVSQFKDAPAGERPALDMKQLGIVRVLAYVKEWSFVDFKGEPLPVTEDWLRKFDLDTFAEVIALVEAHHDACEAASEAIKNDRAGATKS